MKKLRHESLVAWQRADDLFIKLHQLALGFPAHERFELGSQLRRAAYSVPANIVEGMARRYRRARLHFLNISESSLAEVTYCVHVAARLNYITHAKRIELDADLNAAGAPLVGLIRSTRLIPLVIPVIAAFVGAAIALIGQHWLH
jgi:four helix bundle protein